MAAFVPDILNDDCATAIGMYPLCVTSHVTTMVEFAAIVYGCVEDPSPIMNLFVLMRPDTEN